MVAVVRITVRLAEGTVAVAAVIGANEAGERAMVAITTATTIPEATVDMMEVVWVVVEAMAVKIHVACPAVVAWVLVRPQWEEVQQEGAITHSQKATGRVRIQGTVYFDAQKTEDSVDPNGFFLVWGLGMVGKGVRT